MAPIKRQEELASKWLNGTITPQEKVEFSAWYKAFPDDQIVLPEWFAQNEAALKARILDNVQKRMVRKLRLQRAIALAASIILVTAIAVWYWQAKTNEAIQNPLALQEDIKPGGNRAMLTLMDGSVFDLSSQKDKIIIGDEITYEDGSVVSASTQSLEISTPKGGQYQLMLPDSTTVWLNSATRLRYPITFKSERREVELLSGEAYFDVASQPSPDGKSGKRPFIVKTKHQEVEVLGTQFNINAYEDKTHITTTLVEGAVNIHHPELEKQHTTSLEPGEQARLENNTVTIHKVDTEEFTAWKDGYFYFNDANVYEVMEQLEKWYDIEVIYKITASEDLFVGKIPRDVSLSVALEVLRTAGLSFSTEGHTLTVLPKIRNKN